MDMLEDLLQEATQRQAPLPAPRREVIAKINYSHDAMVDLIVSNPGISQNAIAATFGYSVSWISQIIATDAFQSRLAERRDEIVDPLIKATVEERFKAIVMRSQEILIEKLSQPAVDAAFALKTMEASAKALGYGARMERHVPMAPMVEQLEELAKNLVKLQRRGTTINGEAQLVEEVK